MTASELLQKDKITPQEFKSLLNQIHKIDCLSFLKKLPDNCIDIVVTSPPYNMGNVDRSENPKRVKADFDNTKAKGRVNNPLFTEGYSDFDDCLPYSEYVKQQRTLLKELTRVLTNTGAIFYNNKWREYSGEVDTLNLITDGFCVRQLIMWNKFSTMCYNDRMFAPRYEVIYFITKTNIKDGNMTKVNKFGSNLGDIWTFNREMDNDHPAPFPIDLPYNAIHSIDNQGKKLVVYDPYMGSGTTAAAAIGEGYDFIGTDLSATYIEKAMKRVELNKVSPEIKNLYGNKTEQSKNFRQFTNDVTGVQIKKLDF